METLERLLTVDDLAEYFDVQQATIYAWRYHRQGPPGFRVGRHLRFRRSDIEEWLSNQLAESDQGARRRF